MSLLEDGYRSAKAVTFRHAKSFSFASMVLFGERRRGAFALYAFCRRLDDCVDDADGPERAQQLSEVRGLLDALFDRGEVGEVRGFPQSELHALRDTCARFGIPKQPFVELVAGMEMDLVQDRYSTWRDLDLYCYRVAGVVGLMMAPLLGTTNPTALGHAADLGRAMQLTNIVRDVKEDLGRGRVYLPLAELRACGVSEMELRRGVVTEGVERLLRLQLDRARALYASALRGVAWLPGFAGPLLVALMASLYGGILDVVERRRFDIFSSRASVSLGGKLWRLVKVLVTPRAASAPLVEESR